MLNFTICLLYLMAGSALVVGRMRQDSTYVRPLALAAFVAATVAIVLHGRQLYVELMDLGLSLSSAASLIGLQLGLIAILAAFDARLRGLAAGLLLIAAVTSLAGGRAVISPDGDPLNWQLRSHVLTSMFAYGLLTAGALIAIYALLLEHRLRDARMSSMSALFAPLETTEKLLFAVLTAGFTVLALSVVSGITFIEDLFGQHLVHKTTLSLTALLIFGVLLLGRYFAGWRGKQAIYLYLSGFAVLCLAYFGSRFILEEILGRSWS